MNLGRTLAWVSVALMLAACSAERTPLPTEPVGDTIPPAPPVSPPPSELPLYFPLPPPQLPSDPPRSDRLAATVSLAFGDAPVEGLLYLLPGLDGIGTLYTVDLDEDGAPDHSGVLERALGFSYRFEAPGPHRIEVNFSGPGGTQTIERWVVVNDLSVVQLLARTKVDPDAEEGTSFEGIAVDPGGEHVYVANYRGGSLSQLVASDLSEIARLDSIPYSIEGLSITPSGDLLVAAYKYGHVSVVAVPSMAVLHHHERSVGSFFVHALDDRLALFSGRSQLTLFDTQTGQIIDVANRMDGNPLYAWHFDVSPDGTTAAVAGRHFDPRNTVSLVELLSLRTVKEIEIPVVDHVVNVANDPHEARLYILGNELEPSEDGGNYLSAGHFVVVDMDTGAVLRDLPLGPSYCGVYCVANPVARSRSGRYVAMEWNGGSFIIDTSIDLPISRVGVYGYSGYGFSVAASPLEDVFFFLGANGDVFKVGLRH
jgi:hypothetical protein